LWTTAIVVPIPLKHCRQETLMALNRLMQIAAVLEDTPGTLQGSLFTAANMKYLVIDPSMDYEIPLFERNYKRASFTTIEGLAGLKTGSFRFQLEMAGHAIATPDLPVWDLFMQACGFKSATTTSVPFTGESGGPFRHGETVTASGTGASGTATVVHDTYGTAAGAGTVYLADDTVVWATAGATTLTGGTSGATCIVGAGVSSSDAGQSWWPINEPTLMLTHSGTPQPTVGEVLTGDTSGAKALIVSNPTATTTVVRLYNGIMFSSTETITDTTNGAAFETLSAAVQQDIPSISMGLIEDGIAKRLSGCRGNWSMEANVGEPGVMTFEFQGKSEAPLDQSLIDESTITFESKVPPVLLSSALIFGTEGDGDSGSDYSPRFGSIGFNLNNDVNPRIDANNATGILEMLITARAASGSFDPEIDLEASYSILANFRAGTIMRSKFNVGTAAGNRFYCTIPGMQATGLNTGERAGVSNRAFEFMATTGHMTNASDALNKDNDIIITYLL